MTAPKKLILASGSAIRAAILNQAGVAFDVIKPDVDEDAIKKAGEAAGHSLRQIAQTLADSKALAVAAPDDTLVLGSDQIMAFEGRGFDKPKSMIEAQARLEKLQGRDHSLINAVAIARSGRIVFRSIDEPRLFMRAMSAAEIELYLAAAGEGVLSSVGAYQVENLGSRLFDRIEGDYFAVLGLSLHKVLRYLRETGLIEF